MTIQRSISLPAFTPSAWELRLPDYPVISNRWRSTEFPELLGSLPSGAKWSLTFENMSNAEALALLLPWRATGGGQLPLSLLPGALAGGVDDADFRKRLTNTTWSIASEPRKEPVKNGRFNVTIELVYELDFNSLYGPVSQFLSLPTDDVLLLQFVNSLAVAAIPTEFYKPTIPITDQPIISLNAAETLAVAGTAATKEARKINAQIVLALSASESLAVAALPTSFVKRFEQFTAQVLLNLGIPNDLGVAASSATFARTVTAITAQASINLNESNTLAAIGEEIFLSEQITEITAESLLLLGITLDSIELDLAGDFGSFAVAAVDAVKTGRIDFVLSLDTSEGLSVATGPTELFTASRIRSANVLVSFSEFDTLAVAALPVQLFGGSRIKSAQARLNLDLARGLDPVALPVSFSPKPVQQFNSQSALNLDISRELSAPLAGPTLSWANQGSDEISLLLHMDGSNSSTTFTDNSLSARTVTVFGNAQISTAQSNSGGASGLFDGNGDYLLVAAGGTGIGISDFTIECWIRKSTFSGYQCIASLVPGTDDNSLYVDGNDIIWWDGGAKCIVRAMAANTWYHVAVTRRGGTIRTFLNGAVSADLFNSKADIANNTIRIGTRGSANGEWFNGHIDELRITVGLARYVGNFTIPTPPFPDP